jgi:hypothetical protein
VEEEMEGDDLLQYGTDDFIFNEEEVMKGYQQVRRFLCYILIIFRLS